MLGSSPSYLTSITLHHCPPLFTTVHYLAAQNHWLNKNPVSSLITEMLANTKSSHHRPGPETNSRSETIFSLTYTFDKDLYDDETNSTYSCNTYPTCRKVILLLSSIALYRSSTYLLMKILSSEKVY